MGLAGATQGKFNGGVGGGVYAKTGFETGKMSRRGCNYYVEAGPHFTGQSHVGKAVAGDGYNLSADHETGVDCPLDDKISLRFAATFDLNVGETAFGKTLGASIGAKAIAAVMDAMAFTLYGKGTILGHEEGGQKISTGANMEFSITKLVRIGGDVDISSISNRNLAVPGPILEPATKSVLTKTVDAYVAVALP
ncbi:MAG: hypothetical protein ACXWP5_05650, partial [Bdellovibrionota bacterium]